MSDQIKCKYCLSVIRKDCKKCPNCKEWVKRGSIHLAYFLVVVCSLYVLLDSDEVSNSTSTYSNKFISAERHKLKILWHRPENNDGNEKYIIGEMKNDGTENFDSVSIEASFYDKERNLIKLGRAYLSGNIKPGVTKKFEITYDCGACEIKKMYEHYELEITNASMPFRY